MIHMVDLAALQTKCATLIEERDHVKVALDELKASRMLLSTCNTCPSLVSPK